MQQVNKISHFIFHHPDVVASLLAEYKIHVAKPLTLNGISEAVLTAIYSGNTSFETALSNRMASEGFLNFEPITLAVASALSIGSTLLGSSQAKKQRELMKAIALAQLSNAKNLGELDIRTKAETEREKILLQSLQQYQSDLQGQSTQRIRDTWIYVGMMAAGISMIFGVSLIFQKKQTV